MYARKSKGTVLLNHTNIVNVDQISNFSIPNYIEENFTLFPDLITFDYIKLVVRDMIGVQLLCTRRMFISVT